MQSVKAGGTRDCGSSSSETVIPDFFISSRANQLDGRRIKNRVIIYVEINSRNIATGSALPPSGILTRDCPIRRR